MIAARRLKQRKGVAFLFFVLIMLPVLLASLGISTDFGRLIIAHRQASDTADSVVLAAAHGFNNSGGGLTAYPNLNATNAKAYATQTFVAAVGTPSSGSMLSSTESPKLSAVTLSKGNTQVSVTISYKLTGFIIVDYFTGKRNNLTFDVTRTAEICSSANADFCAYPLR